MAKKSLVLARKAFVLLIISSAAMLMGCEELKSGRQKHQYGPEQFTQDRQCPGCYGRGNTRMGGDVIPCLVCRGSGRVSR